MTFHWNETKIDPLTKDSSSIKTINAIIDRYSDSLTNLYNNLYSTLTNHNLHPNTEFDNRFVPEERLNKDAYPKKNENSVVHTNVRYAYDYFNLDTIKSQINEIEQLTNKIHELKVIKLILFKDPDFYHDCERHNDLIRKLSDV